MTATTARCPECGSPAYVPGVRGIRAGVCPACRFRTNALPSQRRRRKAFVPAGLPQPADVDRQLEFPPEAR